MHVPRRLNYEMILFLRAKNSFCFNLRTVTPAVTTYYKEKRKKRKESYLKEDLQ